MPELGHWLDDARPVRDSVRMGRVLRYFLVHDDDTIERIAAARFERLTRRDSDERWPEHAGKRLRYALYILDQGSDGPRLTHAEFGFLVLDAEGRRDRAAFEKSMHDAVDLMGSVLCPPASDSNVIGSQAFARRRYAVEHKWEPSETIVRAIAEAIVDPPSSGRAKVRRSRPEVGAAPMRRLSLVPVPRSSPESPREEGTASGPPRRRRVGRSKGNSP
jgi:hypothetical protein